MSDIDRLREALSRAVTLLDATVEFIHENPVVAEYEVFYDEATCDGYCLAEDCRNAAIEARSALANTEVAQ